MTDLNDVADRLHRTAKMALDTGEAASPEEAERIFSGYKLQIVVGPDVAENAVAQAALLTAVNCAVRTLLGGVTVVGAGGPLRVTLPPYDDLAAAVVGLGGALRQKTDSSLPTMIIGDARQGEVESLAIRATFDGWAGGVAPAAGHIRLAESGGFTPAGVLAGALGVAEIFQRLRGGNPYACRRAIGLNLWRPETDWRSGEIGPALERLPSLVWLVGLGNLGQAYLWTLGLLPYGAGQAELVLQDTDTLAGSNLSTSLLTTTDIIGSRKTRSMASWAERRGFKTAIVERVFRQDFEVAQSEPTVALIGVDNALARQAIENVGFSRAIETGLGKGPKDFLGIDLHTFPASKPAVEVWRDTEPSDVDITLPAYRAMLEATGDRCGTLRLAGRSIGAPFVGAVAAALAIAELVRLSAGNHRHELVSCHLRDLAGRTVIKGAPWPSANIGSLLFKAQG
jgi:hypothetical protein